jgi:hypothetical protein
MGHGVNNLKICRLFHVTLNKFQTAKQNLPTLYLFFVRQ